jgi:hypothetical protein
LRIQTSHVLYVDDERAQRAGTMGKEARPAQ